MKPGSEAESPPGPMVSMFHIATVLASCQGSRCVSFVYCLGYICLRLEQHHRAHSNDGKSAALCSAAKSSTFLGIGEFVYSSFKVCTTLWEGWRIFQELPNSCHGERGRRGRTRGKIGERGKHWICDWGYPCFPGRRKECFQSLMTACPSCLSAYVGQQERTKPDHRWQRIRRWHWKVKNSCLWNGTVLTSTQ